MRTLTRGPYGVHYKGSWLKVTLGPLQLGTLQPRPQGFSLKKWVKGKALETRLGTPRGGEDRGSKKESTLGTRLDGRSRVQIFYIPSCYSQERMHITMCKKIPKPLWMQKILDVISPYLQPSTYLLHANVMRSQQEIECLPREINPDQDRSRSAPDQGGYEIIVRCYLSKYLLGRTLIWSHFPVQKWAIQSLFIRLELFMALYYQCMVTPKSSLDFRHYLAFDLYSSTQPATTGHSYSHV